MNLLTEEYSHYITQIPQSGRHIIAQQTDNEVVVYQAYNKNIAKFAVENQYFGGNHFNYSRMSWLKPNFLWMMYRCGWAEKHNQEHVLAIWIKKEGFDEILKEAVFSAYQSEQYASREEWKNELENKEVRLQWDPDHDPFGEKQERRAIQLGLKGEILKRFGKDMIVNIENITPFVKRQKEILDKKGIEELIIPTERIYKVEEVSIKQNIGIYKSLNFPW